MGGYGAAFLGSKHPERCGAVSILSGNWSKGRCNENGCDREGPGDDRRAEPG